MRIAELRIELVTGGVVTEYMKVKSGKQLEKRLNKMIRRGELGIGAVMIDMDNVLQMGVKWHELH